MERAELFDKYLSSSLNKSEKEKFEKDLKADAELDKDFKIHKAIKYAIQQTGESDLRKRFQSLQKKNDSSEFSSEFDDRIQQYMNAAYYEKNKKNSGQDVKIDYETIKNFLKGGSKPK